MSKCRRKSNVGITNEKVKGIYGAMEEIKIPTCSRKGHVDIIHE